MDLRGISMNKLRLLSAGLGVSLIISIATPGYSQINSSNVSGTNTSNVTGTNVSNSTGTNSSNRSGLDAGRALRRASGTSGYNQSIINQAQQLANQLNAAKEACNKIDQEVQQQPRRFARQASRSCVNPCETVCQESRANAESFLESIKNPKPEQLENQIARSRQLW
jgi:hypothetical protein